MAPGYSLLVLYVPLFLRHPIYFQYTSGLLPASNFTITKTQVFIIFFACYPLFIYNYCFYFLRGFTVRSNPNISSRHNSGTNLGADDVQRPVTLTCVNAKPEITFFNSIFINLKVFFIDLFKMAIYKMHKPNDKIQFNPGSASSFWQFKIAVLKTSKVS